MSQSQSSIPPQAIGLLDKTGRMANDWYRFMQDLYQFSGLAKKNFPLYEDLIVCGDQMLWEAADGPPLGTLSGGLRLYEFSPAVNQSLRFQVQLPHGWIPEDDVYPFVQWAVPSVAGAGSISWQFEYSWGTIGQSFPAATTLTISSSVSGGLQYSEFPQISGTGKNFSSNMVCRIGRDAAGAGDTYGGSVFILSAGVHYLNSGHGAVRKWP